MAEVFEDAAEALVANAEQGTEVGACARSLDEGGDHVGGEVAVGSGIGGLGVGGLEVHVARGVVADERELKRVE